MMPLLVLPQRLLPLSPAILLFTLATHADAVVVTSENFDTDLGTWTAGIPPQSPDSSLVRDVTGERMYQSNPGTNFFAITDTEDLDAGHKITIDDGDKAIFTVDFEFNLHPTWLDFILEDDAGTWQAGFRYNNDFKEVAQFGFASTPSTPVVTPLLPDTMYTAILELAYSGGSWTPTFTINGEVFVGNSDSSTPAGKIVHRHLQSVTVPMAPTDIYYDNTQFEFIAAVPEPGTALLAVSGCGILALRRRRHDN